MTGKCGNIPDNLYKPGEVIIGGVFSLIQPEVYLLNFTVFPERSNDAAIVKFKHYQHVLTLIFAIHEINDIPSLLPNITLGFHIFDNLFDLGRTDETILDLLFKQRKNTLNDKWDRKDVFSVIGGLTSEHSIQMATILSNYKIPQLTYGSFEATLSSKIDFPFVYRMAPRETAHHMGIVQLLLHFRWTWIGLIVSDDDAGESFVQKLIPLLVQNSICVAFLKRNAIKNLVLNNNNNEGLTRLTQTLLLTDANVIILATDSVLLNSLTLFLEEFSMKALVGKVWIMPLQWYFSTLPSGELVGRKIFYGALSFSVHTNSVPGFQDFLRNVKFDKTLKTFFCLFWQYAFQRCANCRGEEKLEDLPANVFEMDMSGESYSIYNAIYAMAHALHAIYFSRKRPMLNKGKLEHGNIQPWQLHSFMENIHFNNGAVQEVLFENKELSIGYDIINWVTFPNQSFQKVLVGSVSSSKLFSIIKDAIVWNRRLKQIYSESRNSINRGFGHAEVKFLKGCV
ncbi:vomeronasal type-2 receptor 26-like [Rhineura floridana]|uniref:vomeronasal type-2 receptor 26-like n=1 Tax=Rhineura floridana TaxID=261503 RepID=UPI002AC883DD|nr:vomeronasal type-2 receptor 26-like [Rhineura floridana]